ncbi:MAG: hypothetical protein DMF53_08805 [Acidobacteria bacterium]|jgi:hypothetical protein|nr:MAG: hypothetical protein DMF53_08805 [Acidobacteriota bacterium]
MDITNSTDMDTKYKVSSGGGSPMGEHHQPKDFPLDEAVSWPTLHAGSRVSYSPKSSGPWTIYFVVQGKGLVVTTESSQDRLTLMRSGAGFQVQVN